MRVKRSGASEPGLDKPRVTRLATEMRLFLEAGKAPVVMPKRRTGLTSNERKALPKHNAVGNQAARAHFE
jgi:hypothetical protein